MVLLVFLNIFKFNFLCITCVGGCLKLELQVVELPDGCWVLNSGPPGEQGVLLTAKHLSLQPSPFCCLRQGLPMWS